MSEAAILQLAERLEKAQPSNAFEHCEIFERIRELRSSNAGLPPQAQRYLEAAGMLVSYLVRMGELSGEDVSGIAVRLLRGAGEAVAEKAAAPRSDGGESEADPALPRTKAKTPADPKATDLLGEMMLGQILLKRGHILEEHIHQALKVQRSTSQRIGDILVKIRACTKAQVNDAAAYQAKLRRLRDVQKAARHGLDHVELRGTGLKLVGEVMLGELLIQRNVITRRQLERALEVQKQDGSRIGEALVRIGATTMEQIEQALRIQGRDRRMGAKPSGD